MSAYRHLQTFAFSIFGVSVFSHFSFSGSLALSMLPVLSSSVLEDLFPDVETPSPFRVVPRDDDFQLDPSVLYQLSDVLLVRMDGSGDARGGSRTLRVFPEKFGYRTLRIPKRRKTRFAAVPSSSGGVSEKRAAKNAVLELVHGHGRFPVSIPCRAAKNNPPRPGVRETDRTRFPPRRTRLLLREVSSPFRRRDASVSSSRTSTGRRGRRVFRSDTCFRGRETGAARSRSSLHAR